MSLAGASSHTVSAAPVIAIDGPTASGKGTVAQMVATQLGFHYLDSGALYRITALAAMQEAIGLDDAEAVAELARGLRIQFVGTAIVLSGEDVSEDIRTEPVSQGASKVAAHPLVRDALLDLQRQFATLPGLVADGRDMGSVVFPHAKLKVYLSASAAVRARRRTNQLIAKGAQASYEAVLKELEIRDARDMGRAVAPLKHYPDAMLLITDELNAQQAAAQIVAWFHAA
jgi:CMP/dCMP kinase